MYHSMSAVTTASTGARCSRTIDAFPVSCAVHHVSIEETRVEKDMSRILCSVLLSSISISKTRVTSIREIPFALITPRSIDPIGPLLCTSLKYLFQQKDHERHREIPLTPTLYKASILGIDAAEQHNAAKSNATGNP